MNITVMGFDGRVNTTEMSAENGMSHCPSHGGNAKSDIAAFLLTHTFLIVRCMDCLSATHFLQDDGFGHQSPRL